MTRNGTDRLKSRSSAGILAVVGILILSGCVSTQKKSVTATPSPSKTQPGKKHVRVSLQNRAVYVYDEKNKPILVSAVAIGRPNTPTPTGSFKAFNKQPKKRSGSYGFHVTSSEIRPGKRSSLPSNASYIGYPMPWWVEFKHGYGFHAGSVWPTPRTHGCLRLHKSVAPKFFQLVDESTPIHIAHSLPEDSKPIGQKIWRPSDYATPNSPNALLISNVPFSSTANHHVHY